MQEKYEISTFLGSHFWDCFLFKTSECTDRSLLRTSWWSNSLPYYHILNTRIWPLYFKKDVSIVKNDIIWLISSFLLLIYCFLLLTINISVLHWPQIIKQKNGIGSTWDYIYGNIISHFMEERYFTSIVV